MRSCWRRADGDGITAANPIELHRSLSLAGTLDSDILLP